MDNMLPSLAASLWFGVLTSVSPCPLATNVAAVAFVSRRLTKPSHIFIAGLLYTVGRALAYIAVASLLLVAVFSIPSVSFFLQRDINRALGPILFLSGLVLLGLLPLPTRGIATGEAFQRRIEAAGLFGALLLGALFALAFCPVSAALFFGSLMPLSAAHRSFVLMPALFGIGTALPVLVFSVILSRGAASLSASFDRLTRLERPARYVTGGFFVLYGLWLSAVHLFGFTL